MANGELSQAPGGKGSEAVSTLSEIGPPRAIAHRLLGDQGLLELSPAAPPCGQGETFGRGRPRSHARLTATAGVVEMPKRATDGVGGEAAPAIERTGAG